MQLPRAAMRVGCAGHAVVCDVTGKVAALSRRTRPADADPRVVHLVNSSERNETQVTGDTERAQPRGVCARQLAEALESRRAELGASWWKGTRPRTTI